MTIAANQDFITTAGDDVYPIFTVRDGSGVAIDISTVSQITWSMQTTSADTAPLLTLKKSTGGIVFTNTGVDGKFTVNIGKALTTPLDGWYQHYASITDAVGNVTTVAVGRMKVGLMPSFTYDAAKVATVPLFQVRRWVGDVIANDVQLQDNEVLYALSERGSNVIGAAADCCRFIAAQYSRKADTTSPGSLQTAFGALASKYSLRAKELEALSMKRGYGVTVYAGGISMVDKTTVQSNTDRVQPQFNLGMTDNRLPVGQVGNETPTMPMAVPN